MSKLAPKTRPRITLVVGSMIAMVQNPLKPVLLFLFGGTVLYMIIIVRVTSPSVLQSCFCSSSPISLATPLASLEVNLPGIFQWQFTKYPALHKGTCHIQEVQMLQSLGMGSPQDLATKNAQQSHTSLRAPVSAGLQLMADHFGKNWIQQIYKSQSSEDVVFSCKDGQGILDSSCCNHLLQPPHCPVVIPQNCWRKMFSESHFFGTEKQERVKIFDASSGPSTITPLPQSNA